MSMTEGQEPEVEVAHVPIGEDEAAEPEAPKRSPKAKRGKLLVFPWSRAGRQRLNLAWRAVKMMNPRCDTCQESQTPGWWRDCPHNPYFRTEREDIVTPVIMCENCLPLGKKARVPDGALVCPNCNEQNFIQDGTETKPAFRLRPNLREVRIGDESNSGNSYNHMRTKGYLLPQEQGIASYCEFSRCYEQNPQVQTSYGLYCCAEEAKLVALFADQEAVEIFDMRKRKIQLRGVSLG